MVKIESYKSIRLIFSFRSIPLYLTSPWGLVEVEEHSHRRQEVDKSTNDLHLVFFIWIYIFPDVHMRHT